MEEETVTITLAEYNALKLRDFKLECLEDYGVDNWEWYSDALSEGGYYDAIEN